MNRALMLALFCLASCAQILDIEDRKLISIDGGVDGGVGDDASVDSGLQVSGDCAKYCKDARELCTADQKVQLYQTDETCAAVCAQFSKDPSTTGNTLACRIKVLDGLRSVGSNEAQSQCPAASIGGGPPPMEPNGVSCGNDCESFCTMRKSICPAQAGDIDCERKCRALIDDELFNADADFKSGEDSLNCRLAHLSAAITYGSRGDLASRDAHCSHSGIRSEVQCDFKDPVPPSCESFCKLVGVACTGDSQIYDNQQQCLEFCKQLEPGTTADTKKLGTLRCLRECAYNALAIGPAQCSKASVAGDDCLGGRCGSYCFFAQKGCPEAFMQKYPGNTQQECVAECTGLQGATANDPFSVTLDKSQRGPTLQCRLLRLERVLGKTDTSAATCAAALGITGSTCGL